MAGPTTKLKPFTRSSRVSNPAAGFASASGVTLVELLLALAVGMMIIGSAFALTMSNRRLLAADQERTSTNQNLRSALDILAADVRVAGEGLGSASLPVIAVQNGNELVLRRSVLDDILPACNDSGWFGGVMFISRNSAPGSGWSDPNRPECDFNPSSTSRNKDDDNSLPDDFKAWEDYRTQKGGSARAYIYSRTRNYGEFFDYVDRFSFDGNYAIRRSGNWTNTYRMNEQTSLYLIEEHRYRLSNGVLELVENGNDTQRIVNGLTSFTVTAIMSDGSERTTFGTDVNDNWKDLRAIRINLVGEGGRTLSSEFFPRNALSR